MPNEYQTDEAKPKQQPAVEPQPAVQPTVEGAQLKQQAIPTASALPQAVAAVPAQQPAVSPATATDQADNAAPLRTLTIELLVALLNDRSGTVNIVSDLKGLRRELRPFNSWKDINVIDKDVQVEERCIDSLEEIARTIPGARSRIQVLSLAAKNRAEALSEKSDFYPASIPLLVTFFVVFLGGFMDGGGFKLLLSTIALVLVSLFLNVRIDTRRQVADLKVIANILDVVEKRLSNAGGAPSATDKK
ncbi:hypothetical protein [Massilia sp. LC238]|uniref:hypothetical protein n=1 Tax=Massilia sp. LC238 TaxID=1502852 RepID=UPI0004E32CB5|nr:hypothetical protein [Massilia sp. LC238]KFC65649.1 hypothetical protein FG94_03734 [Massilia sp. LC238]